MGRERKTSHGNSNTSGRSKLIAPPGTNLQKQSQIKSPTKFHPTSIAAHNDNKFLNRVPLSPVDKKQDVYFRIKREVDGSSCWRGDPIAPLQYKTDYGMSFEDPSKTIHEQHEFEHTQPPGAATERRSRQLGAVEKFMRIAQSRYGSVSKMFLVFKKVPGDYISFKEFHENISRRGMDNEFTKDYQQLVFNKFAKKVGTGDTMVPIDDLLEYVAEKSISADVPKRDSSEVTCALFERLAQIRQENKDRITKSKITSAVDLNLTKAWGDYNDIIPNQRVDEIVTELSKDNTAFQPEDEYTPDVTTNTKRAVSKKAMADKAFDDITQYVSSSSIDLARVPFLDSKTENLRNLKLQSNRIEKQLMGQANDGIIQDVLRLQVRNTLDRVYTPRQAKDLNETINESALDSKTLESYHNSIMHQLKIAANADLPLDERQAVFSSKKNGPGYDEFNELGSLFYDKRNGQLRQRPKSVQDLELLDKQFIDQLDIRDQPHKEWSGLTGYMAQKQERIAMAQENLNRIAAIPSAASICNKDITEMTKTMASDKFNPLSFPPKVKASPFAALSNNQVEAKEEIINSPSPSSRRERMVSPTSPKLKVNIEDTDRNRWIQDGHENLSMYQSRSAPELDVPQIKSNRSLRSPTTNDNTSSSPLRADSTVSFEDSMEDIPLDATTSTIIPVKSLSGRKMAPIPVMDWSRVGIGGDAIAADSPLYIDDKARFNSTSRSSFPALVYRSSQPVARAEEMISDAQAAVNKERKRFNAVKRRSDANKLITKNRLEFEEAKAGMLSLKRQLNSSYNMMRYQANGTINDLVKYKKQPMQVMSKKPNEKLSAKMWRGQIVLGKNDLSQPFKDRTEDRDFKTTYDSELGTSYGTTFHPHHDTHATNFHEFQDKHHHDWNVNL